MNHNMKLLITTLALGILVGGVMSQPHRQDIKRSNRLERKPLAAIVKDKLELFREIIYKGDDGLNLPVLDVYQSPIPLEVNITDRKIRYYCSLDNIQVAGLGAFVIENIEIKMLKKYIILDVSIPELKLTSDYKMNGLYLQVVPVYGDGEASAILKGTRLELKGNFAMGDGFSVSNTEAVMNLDDIKIHFGNLLNNEPLAEVIGEVISVSLKVQFEKMKETLEKKVAQMVENLVNSAMSPNSAPSFMSFKPDSLKTVALANDYMDEILENIDNLIVLSNLEPFDLPDFEEIAHVEGPVGNVIKAGVIGYRGKFTGMGTLHRIGDVVLETRPNHVAIKANIGVYALRASYKVDLVALLFEKSFKAKGDVRKAGLTMGIDVDLITREVTLTDFIVSEFGHIDVVIDAGLFNPVSWIVSPLLELLANSFKTTLISEIETVGAKLVNEMLQGLL